MDAKRTALHQRAEYGYKDQRSTGNVVLTPRTPVNRAMSRKYRIMATVPDVRVLTRGVERTEHPMVQLPPRQTFHVLS